MTGSATIIVTQPSVGGTVTTNDPTTVCSGSNSGTLTLSGHTGSVVRWEASTNGGSTWNTIANTNTSQPYINLTATTQYRAVVKNGVCAEAFADAATITVNQASASGTITTANPTTVCFGSNSGTLTLGGKTGDVVRWETNTDNAGWVTVENTSTSLPYTDLTATTQYRAVVQSGVCPEAFSSAFTITVVPAAPEAAGPITGDDVVCQGNTRTYSVPAIVQASVYNWSLPSGATITSGANTNSITVSFGTNAISGAIKIKGVNVCGEGEESELQVTVNPLLPATTNIAGPTAVCQGAQGVAFTADAILGATSYAWTLPTGASIITGSGSNEITVNFAANAQTGNVTVKGVDDCGEGAAFSVAVTVNPLPVAAGAITGLSSVCQGQTNVTYTVPAIANATSYVWTVPAGATITAGANTSAITVSYSATATSGSFTVKGTNSCGDGALSAAFPVTVNPLPAAAGAITGSSTVCQGQNSVSYLVPAIANATSYVWTVPAGATITAGANTSAITVNYSATATSGNFTVKGRSCGDGALSAAFPVTVNAQPTANAGADKVICSGGSTTIGSAAQADFSYSWSPATGLSSATLANPTVTLTNTTSAAVNRTYTLTVTNTATGCSKTDDVVVTVNPLVHVIVRTFYSGTNNEVTQICSGMNLEYRARVYLGGVFTPASPNETKARPSISGGADVTDQFNFEWLKNGSECGPCNVVNNISPVGSAVGGNSNLSSSDYIQVIATRKSTSNASLSCSASGTNGNYLSNKVHLDASSYFSVNLSASYNNQPLPIEEQPNKERVSTICENAEGSIKLTATITDSAPADNPNTTSPDDYQFVWKKNGTVIATTKGATNNTMDVPVSTMANNDVYSVEFSVPGGCGAAISSLKMNILAIPRITAQPVNKAICANSSGQVFEVVATGSGITFQWQFSANGQAPWANVGTGTTSTVATGTKNILSLTNVQANQGGQYQVVVTGACTPAATSENKTLTVNPLPVVALAPFGPVCYKSGIFPLSGGSVTNGVTGTGIYYVNGVPATSINTGVVDTYTVTYRFTTTAGCISTSESRTIRVSDRPVWTGAEDENWFNAANWDTGCVPTYETDAVIPEVVGAGYVAGTSAKVLANLIPNTNDRGKVKTLYIKQDGTLTIEAGAILDLKGDLVTKDGVHQGNLDGDPTSRIIFSNSNVQQIGGGSFGDLILEGTQPKELAGEATVKGRLILTFGTVKLGANNLIIGERVNYTGSIINYDKNHYVITDGNGRLWIERVGTTAKFFPVGLSAYNPVTIANGGNDDFGVRVEDNLTGNTDVSTVGHVFRTWDVDKTDKKESDNVTLTLNWNSSDERNLDPTRAFLSHKGTNGWLQEEGFGFHNLADPNRYSLTQTGVKNFSPFAVGSGWFNDPNPLPVTLSAFRADKQGADALLTWETASEKGNKGFGVEVSTDGEIFRSLGFVSSKGANSQSKLSYSFLDRENGKFGTRYYRLKQTDLDGTVAYSAAKALSFDGLQVGLAAYPNPFSGELTLEVVAEKDDRLQLTVTDALGRVVMSKETEVLKGTNKVSLTLDAQYPTGLYVITARYNGTVQQAKVVKR